MLRKISLFAACVAGGGLAVGACGDDGGNNPDARRFDASHTPDAPNFDAAPPSFSGTLSMLESQVLLGNGSGGIVAFGSGPSMRLAFVDAAEIGTPVFDDTGGGNFGCKVFEYTPAQYAATIGHDLGTMDIAAGDGTPPMPTCGFTAGVGYSCPDLTTASAGDNAIIGPGPQAGLLTLTDPDNTFSGANSGGRYVSISGATDAANNGLFPIVGVAAATTIVYANPVGVQGTLGGSHLNIAGVGPIPGAPPETFISNDDSFDFTFASSNPNAIPSFTANLANTGDNFTLDAASEGNLIAPPLDGAAFTLDCPDAASCGDGIASVLNIQTTDGDVTGLSQFTLPPPVTKATLARCTSTIGLGAAVTIPAEVSAYLMSSGATRVQSTFVRASLVLTTTPPTNNKVTLIGGSSKVGFYTVP